MRDFAEAGLLYEQQGRFLSLALPQNPDVDSVPTHDEPTGSTASAPVRLVPLRAHA